MLGNLHVRFGERDYGNLFPKGTKAPCPYSTRQGFKLYWRFKSRKISGRPKISREIRTLIQRMSQDNPTWGVPRITSELALLGYEVAESTVARYMYRQKKPPSQTWKTFFLNHADQIAAIDFFTMPTVTYRIFYVFIILRHSDRKILHFNITQNPSAIWTAQQIIEAFPFDTHPRFILRDRDRIYGEYFRKRIKHMGIDEVLIAPRSPWQSPYVERVSRYPRASPWHLKNQNSNFV